MSGKFPRVDVGISDDVDVAIVVADASGSIAVVYRDLDQAMDLAKLIQRAVHRAHANRRDYDAMGSES